MLRTCAAILLSGILAAGRAPAAQSDAPLPPGVRAVWDLSKASREATPSRESVCLNGLWRWQPAGELGDVVPRRTRTRDRVKNGHRAREALRLSPAPAPA